MPIALATEASDIRVAVIGVSSSPTPGANVVVDLDSGATLFKWTAAQDEAITATGKHFAGMRITCQVLDSGTRTLTFGSGFKPSDTVVGTNGKTATISFVSDGTNLLETSRTLAIT